MKVRIPILALTAWVAFAEPEQHGTSTNKSWTGAHNEFFQCDLYHQQLFAAKMDTCIADFNVQTEKLKTQQTIYESKANDKMKELLLDFQKYFNEQFVDFKEEFVDFRKHVDERFDETTDGFNSRFDETTDGFNARFDEIYEKMTFYVTAAIYFGLFLVMLVIPSSHGVPFGDYVWMTYKHMRDSRDLIAIISLVVLPSLAMAFFAKWTSCFDSFLIDFCDRLPLPYLADEPVSTSTTTTAAPPATGAWGPTSTAAAAPTATGSGAPTGARGPTATATTTAAAAPTATATATASGAPTARTESLKFREDKDRPWNHNKGVLGIKS